MEEPPDTSWVRTEEIGKNQREEFWEDILFGLGYLVAIVGFVIGVSLLINMLMENI